MADKKKKIVGVLGAGWLGTPLVERLLVAGFGVRAAHRSAEAVAASRAASRAALFRVDLPDVAPASFFNDLDFLILTLPPGGRRLGEEATQVYTARLGPVVNVAMRDPKLRILFCSSTGVYGDATGWVDETTEVRPNTHSSRAVVAAEELLSAVADRLTIVRLAGLVGPGRHPGRFYGGRSVPIRTAEAPVNLVHQADAVAAIQLLIERGAPAGVFNVCAAAHPAKGEFYGAAAGAIGLEVGAKEDGGAADKIIGSLRLRRLGWSPTHDDLSVFRRP